MTLPRTLVIELPLPRAYLVEGDAAGDRCPTIRQREEPSFCLKIGSGGRVHRAVVEGDEWLSLGRVVSMTTRCSARFMGIPDSYALPENKKLASTIIGNGVCPPVLRALVTPLLTMKDKKPMDSELIIEVRNVDLSETGGDQSAHLLIVEKPGESGYKIVLNEFARAKLALALVESLPALPGEDRGGLGVAENALQDHIGWHLDQHRNKAKNRAMNAAKKAGATTADEARAQINQALGRKSDDRSNLDPTEWDRAAEILKEMGSKQ